MTAFSWEYLSFINLDTPWLSILLTPIVLVLLWGVWMKVVRYVCLFSLTNTKTSIKYLFCCVGTFLMGGKHFLFVLDICLRYSILYKVNVAEKLNEFNQRET